MLLEAKQLTCQCGHSFMSEKEKTWCEKCARPVFYHAKDQRRHKYNQIYVVAMAALAITFLMYLFIEMIADPLLRGT
ncbi:MAG: hypothetical protein QNJ22_20115 [Desulfosarcinaceae bacterium]|nr:hypothetical protein [Desulfosarcinaceae bacterium]